MKRKRWEVGEDWLRERANVGKIGGGSQQLLAGMSGNAWDSDPKGPTTTNSRDAALLLTQPPPPPFERPTVTVAIALPPIESKRMGPKGLGLFYRVTWVKT
ncbi:hypothetical protein KPH14_004516 [Odynerus spinipes]|uniref:Uncharacterized protein n=1 Tax=Odynerus spinipes TaxID=1348599 RepID=A0AAD9RLW5_9HYME|nr:hypothetical protein KPH14_004516 [Odynerus spinipes]